MNQGLGVVAGVLLVLSCAWPSAPRAEVALDGIAVKCQLPPQIRRLGRNTTYLAAGRIVQTTASDCRVRGGKAKAMPASAEVAAPVEADGVMAVMVGGDRKIDACPVFGEIVGLKNGSTLSVRSGPSTTHARLDRLSNGRRVFVCDGSADEAWLGVVYSSDASHDCGVAEPIKEARSYTGPCKVGWVNAGWVRTE